MPEPDIAASTGADIVMGPCPICGKRSWPRTAQTARLRPFCSTRCADVDLGRWFGGAYAIPGPPPELDEDPPASVDVTTRT